jgi:hypothetical protein
MRTRIVAGTMAGVAALAGCGANGLSSGSPRSNVVVSQPSSPTTPSSSPPPSGLEILGRGFTQLRPVGTGGSYVSFAAVLKWNDRTQAATGVSVNISLTNAGGTVVSSKIETIGVIFPGQTTAVADEAQVSGVTGIEVDTLVGSPQPYTKKPPTLTVANPTTSNTGSGMKTTGTVTSTAKTDLRDVAAVAVYYNTAGQIVGGDTAVLNLLPPGSPTEFEIDGTHVIPGVAGTQVYLQITSLTALESP